MHARSSEMRALLNPHSTHATIRAVRIRRARNLEEDEGFHHHGKEFSWVAQHRRAQQHSARSVGTTRRVRKGHKGEHRVEKVPAHRLKQRPVLLLDQHSTCPYTLARTQCRTVELATQQFEHLPAGKAA
jgi:hypothetical protein